MSFELQLENGLAYTLSGADFDVKELANNLNNPSIVFITFGEAVINKKLVLGLFPIQEEK